MIKHFLYLLFVVFVTQTTFAQKKEPKPPSVYKVNLKWEIPAAASFFYFNHMGINGSMVNQTL